MPMFLTSVLLSFLLCDCKCEDKECLAHKRLKSAKLHSTAFLSAGDDLQTEPIREYDENELRQKIERLEKETLKLQRFVAKLLNEQLKLKKRLSLVRPNPRAYLRIAPPKSLRLYRTPMRREVPEAPALKRYLKKLWGENQGNFLEWSRPRPNFQHRSEPRSESFKRQYFYDDHSGKWRDPARRGRKSRDF